MNWESTSSDELREAFHPEESSLQELQVKAAQIQSNLTIPFTTLQIFRMPDICICPYIYRHVCPVNSISFTVKKIKLENND